MQTWLSLGGASLIGYAGIRYLSAVNFGNTPSQGDIVVSAICAGLGVVLFAVSYFTKEKE